MTGAALIALFLVIAVTLLRLRQLISVHLFVGLLLIAPVSLKLASTGYRFVRYYTREQTYRDKGPPQFALRLMAPVLVVATVVVFVSGVLLLLDGPDHKGELVLIHKTSFIVWAVLFGLHVLAHLLHLPQSLRAGRRGEAGRGGEAGRWIALAGALAAGVVLALALLPRFGAWTAPGAFPHHHHHHQQAVAYSPRRG